MKSQNHLWAPVSSIHVPNGTPLSDILFCSKFLDLILTMSLHQKNTFAQFHFGILGFCPFEVEKSGTGFPKSALRLEIITRFGR